MKTMEHKLKISVILAAYHGEKYIAEQLESLFKQTRLPDEILIGDDSEDDATAHAVDSVRPNYNGKLCYIPNSNRLGVVGNFVNLVKLASGDLIFFCDQDDVWLPRKIEILAQVFETEPQCQLAVCNSSMVDAELRPLNETILDGVPHFQEWVRDLNSGGGFFPLLNLTVGFSGHNMAMRKNFSEIFLKIPKEYRYHDIWLEQTAALLGVLRYTDQCLTLFRVHDKNTSSPAVQKVKQGWFRRISEIWSTSNDVFYMASLLVRFKEFIEPYKDNPNRKIVIRYCDYFQKRCRLLIHSRLIRIPMIIGMPGLLKDYFLYGLGTRSLIRDLLSKKGKPE